MTYPKPAHRTQEQKAAGYLGAAQVSLGIAARLTDVRTARRIQRISEQVRKLQQTLSTEETPHS